MTPFYFLFFLLLVAGHCHGDEERADHLLLLETLPRGFSLDRPSFLDIRTNFSGTVRLVESSEFRVVINMSAPDLHAAYKVHADLRAHDQGLLLQVSEKEPTGGVIWLTWLVVGVAGASSLVLVVASLYACWWYRHERSLYDLAEKKSVAGSSQRGVYRSRNSLQVVNLPPLGDLPIVPLEREETEGPHNDDSLKQVPEMPEEEEAEAIEMEELTLLKLKDMDGSDPTANESDPHRLTSQDRNLIKNQLHSQNKNIHKDLLKKDKAVKPPLKDKPTKQPPRRRTATGLYTGVASGPEVVPGSADESLDSETDVDAELDGIRELNPSEPNYENTHERRTTSSFMSPHRSARQGLGRPETSGKLSSLKVDPHADTDRSDSGLQVMADVHKVGMQPEIVKVTTPDKQAHPGFGGSDSTRPTLTTFNSPAQLPPPPAQNKTIRFKEPDEASDKPLPPPVPPKHSSAVRYPPGFFGMGDIPEDPREDCDSVQSGSGRSRYLYGSSEIFDANNPIHTYYNLDDSDIDIPPLDAEDFFSDGGLPSPLSASLGRGKTRDDSSLTGPKSVFFSRDSPLMGVPKPRPYSSIIPRMESNRSDSRVSSGISSDQTSTPMNSEVDSGSPKLPPPPLPTQEDVSHDGSAFYFPPPPGYFGVTESGGPGGNPSSRASVGEYVTLPNNSTKGGPSITATSSNNSHLHHTDNSRRGGGGGGGGGRAALGSKFSHLTLLSVMCVLALTTGVYCKMRVEGEEDTRVDITVFAPLPFLSAKNNTLYFNLHKDTDLEIDGNFKVKAFVLEEPVLKNERHHPCQAPCVHGCDLQTGQCICHKGYRLVDRFNCIDVNECAEGFTRCHPSAGCLNTKGSYTCVCSEDYYGDGKTCQDCDTPCREDQYEEQNCSKVDGKIYEKICKDCTQSCHKGYYLASQCTDIANARCRVCQPPCLDGEYEYRTCSNYHDRQCKNVTSLPSVEASSNIILEEDRKVMDSEVTVEHLLNLGVGYTRYSLKRGTGLHVDISIQTLEAAQQFVPLDLKNVSTSASSPAVLHSHTVQRFCPHPVPDHYILHYTKHQDVTYQLDDQGEIKPCHTFKDHGTFPSDAVSKENSFLCREPGSLTKLFEIPPDIFQTSTHWAERTKRCKSNSEKCEQCTRKCAQQMVGGSSDCSIVGDNNDNGWSPRLQVCYNCCARSNCTNDCRNYHNRRRCQPLKCHHGNLVEFSVFPTWSSNKNSKFFCHITPVSKQRLLEMKYVVRSESHKDPVHTATIKVDGEEEWEKHGRLVHRDKLLNIVIDSQLRKLPDFLEGRISMDNSNFHVGTYTAEGSRVDTTVVSGESIRIHPIKPFGIRVSRADPQKCENDILKESLITGQHQSPYSPDLQLMAVAFQNTSTPFIITRIHTPPTVRITTDRRSFLKGIFPAAILTAGSLTGRMTQNETHWTVEVMGSVNKCPGYLKVVLSDPAYRSTPLFSADVAVSCPRIFDLQFHLPSGDAQGLDRQVVASVADAQQVHHLRLHRPAASHRVAETDRKALLPSAHRVTPAPMKQEKTPQKVPLPRGFIFSIPYMVSVGGAIFLMICLLVIGLIVQPGVPAPEPPILRCHHALFMVIYIFFQFIYSVVATSSVFFLVVIAVNSPRMAFILQYQEQSAASSATHQLELSAMQTYLQRELARQDTHMDTMRGLCSRDMTTIVADMKKKKESQTELARQNVHMDTIRGLCSRDMTTIVADMKKMHSQMVRETEDVFQKHKLEMLLEEHRHRSMQQLSQDLLSFRDKYNQAARTMLLELNHNIHQAHQSIANNTWLAGARFLHGVVTTTRKHINNVDSKPFMEWAHLQNDLSKLIVDVSFSLPSLPKLAEIEEVIEEEAKHSKRSKNSQNSDQLHTTHVYNQWFSPFSHNSTQNNLQFRGARGGDGGSDGEEGRRSFGVFYVFLVILGCLDLLLVLHRMLKAKIGGQLLLYGYPEYMDFRERKDDGDDDVFDDNRRCTCCSVAPICQAVKAFTSQVMSSSFIPKAAIVVVVALLLRGLLHLSSTTLTVQSLHKAGLYHSSDDYLNLHGQLINGRLQAHAHHINTVDFPAYQTWMSTYIQRHHFAFQVYHQQLRRMQRVHMESYCHYLRSLGLTGNCSSDAEGAKGQDSAHGVISPACQFQPVLPKFYKRSESVYRHLSDKQLKVLLDNIRAIIFDTCQIIVIFMSIIVVKELLCAVVWIFIRRSGLIRLRIIYETDQDDPGPSG
ncbi:hypothetical protein ACOMHN_031701 [Nucella lapillus]